MIIKEILIKECSKDMAASAFLGTFSFSNRMGIDAHMAAK